VAASLKEKREFEFLDCRRLLGRDLAALVHVIILPCIKNHLKIEDRGSIPLVGRKK
jgi:hypothetical protein